MKKNQLKNQIHFFNANDEKETITTSDKIEVDLTNKSNDIVSEPNSSDEDNNIIISVPILSLKMRKKIKVLIIPFLKVIN